MNAVFTDVSVILFFYYGVYVFVTHDRVSVHDCASFGKVFAWHVHDVQWAAFPFFILVWVWACFVLGRRDNRWFWFRFLWFVLRLHVNWIGGFTNGARYLTLVQTFIRLFVSSKQLIGKTSKKACFLLLVVLLFQLFALLLKFIKSTAGGPSISLFSTRWLTRWCGMSSFLTPLHLLYSSLFSPELI